MKNLEATPRLRKAVVLASFALLCVAMTSTCFAQDIGDIANNVSSNANAVGKAIQVLGRLGGLILIFGGLFMHHKAHKEQGQGRSSHGLAVVMWLVGAAAFYAGSVVHTTGNTLWGNGGGDNTTIDIGG